MMETMPGMPPMMPMYFTWSTNTIVLFHWWETKSMTGYLFTCVAWVALCVLHEYLRRFIPTLIVTKNGETYHFTSFIYRDQCFDILQHYSHAANNPPLLTFSRSRHISRGAGPIGQKPSYAGNRNALIGEGERSAVLDDGNERLRRTLATAESTRTKGADIMGTLDQQGKQLNRIAGEMEHVHRGLNQADRILGQMETILPGGGRGAAKDFESGTRIERESVPMKHTRIPFLDVTHGKYTPGEFVFPEGDAQRFYIARPVTGEHIAEYMYASLATIKVTPVPTSIIVSFRGAPDLSILAHDYQILVEELVQRPQHEVHVVFEVGVPEFPYYNREGKAVGQVPASRDAGKRDGGGKKGSLFLHGTGTFKKLSAKDMTLEELEAEDRSKGVQLLGTQVQGQIDEGDQLLDGISNVMKDLKHMADDMNYELKYQNAQVQNIDESVDRASGKFSKTNRRVKKLT